MKKSLGKKLFFILTILYQFNLFAQDTLYNHKLKSEPIVDYLRNFITFKSKSARLTKEGEYELDNIVYLISNNKIDKNLYIIFRAITNPSELRKDRYISFKRYKVIIDYIKKRTKVRYNLIRIKDEFIAFVDERNSGVFYDINNCE
jgi:hypothetical protein